MRFFTQSLGEAVSVSRRQSMVRADHAQLSIVQQCVLLKISRSGLYYTPKGESALNLTLMQEIDRAFTDWPFMGVLQMQRYLVLQGYGVGKKRVRRLMRLMGLEPIYQKPLTNEPCSSGTQKISVSFVKS